MKERHATQSLGPSRPKTLNCTRAKNILNRWCGQARDFSPLIALSDMVSSVLLRGSNGKLKHDLNVYYYDKAKQIIFERYADIVEKWNFPVDVHGLPLFRRELPIYVFWWQTLDHAPGLIRETTRIIGERAENPVIFVDKNNYSSLVDLPEFAVKGVQAGSLSLTAFSDILRYNLLARTGGMWIDPTCFLSRDFSEEIYQYPFYTICHQDDWKHPICKGKWATFFLCSGENNPLFGYLSDMINTYWQHERSLAVYLLPDVFLAIGYENIPYIREMIDMVPVNNVGRGDLLRALNDQGMDADFDRLLGGVESGTYIHKLTYKTYIRRFDEENQRPAT